MAGEAGSERRPRDGFDVVMVTFAGDGFVFIAAAAGGAAGMAVGVGCVVAAVMRMITWAITDSYTGLGIDSGEGDFATPGCPARSQGGRDSPGMSFQLTPLSRPSPPAAVDSDDRARRPG
ncbi:hypothetical protein ACF1G0_35145, partial [Streptomyces sp. NPDC013953]|uniref:hypothetical protein n=1 Tax=Streptomyces sp. NPDC013953 TaxID=3364868 RepID=UPI0036FE6C06